MPAPTTSIYLNSTTPAAPTGNQNVKPQTDGAAPEQSISFYPQQATPDLLGVVKPDGTSITVDETGTISSTSTLTAPVLLITPTTETEGLIIRGSDTIAAGWVQGTSYVLPIAGDSGGDLTETVAFSSPVTAGNAIVVIVSGSDGETDDLTITDSLSNSYTQIALCNQVTVFVALNAAGGANTVSVTGNPLTAGCVLIAEYAGLATSSALDTDNTLYYDSFAEVTPSAPNLTMTTSASDLILTIYASDEVCTPGAPEYTTRLTASNSADGSGTLCLADTVGAAGSYSADWTSTSFSNMWSALLIGLKGSPSSTQVAPLAVFEDASGDTLSEVNAQGQIVLPSKSGMPTNAPSAGALAYDSAAQQPVVYNGSTWEAIGGGMTNPMTTEGDTIIGGSSGTATRLAAGSTGQVLTSNGTGTQPSWQSPSGGGGGGGSTHMPFDLSVGVPALSSLTQINISGTVSTVENSGVALTIVDTSPPPDSGASFSALAQAVPASAPYRVAFYLLPDMMLYDYVGFGVGFMDSGGGRHQFMVVQDQGTSQPWSFENQTWNSSTSRNSVSLHYSPAFGRVGGGVWLALRDDGEGTVWWEFSQTGAFWTPFSSVVKSSGWLADYTDVELVLFRDDNTNSPTLPIAISVLCWDATAISGRQVGYVG